MIWFQGERADKTNGLSLERKGRASTNPLQAINNWGNGIFTLAGRIDAANWLFKPFSNQLWLQAASLTQTTSILHFKLICSMFSIIFVFQNKLLFYFRLQYLSPCCENISIKKCSFQNRLPVNEVIVHQAKCTSFWKRWRVKNKRLKSLH